MSKNKKKSWRDSYEIIDVKEGGNAFVYIVKKKASENTEQYALKELKNGSKEKIGRFISEIKLMTEYSNQVDGIIPILDFSEEERWYLMPKAIEINEYLQDKTTGREYVQEIVHGIIQLCETLQKLHDQGITHRDIKPDNIFYWNGRYALGDFGLAHIEKREQEWTSSEKPLGAIFTLAPEMKRDPKNADGKKADVYSLAKTLWILLTGERKGFDGQYQRNNQTIALRFFSNLQGVHLVEIEDLLIVATKDDPNDRPNMGTFRKALEEWLEIVQNEGKVQKSEWNYIAKLLFQNFVPTQASWNKPENIVQILNLLSTLPIYNHMLLPDGGGMDFKRAEIAGEEGFIYIYDSLNEIHLVKPKNLHLTIFSEDSNWNYFFIETDSVEPILGELKNSNSEFLVEVFSGHYADGRYFQYGVYDYDTGELLPKESKAVRRYYKGNFLIVLKYSIYNRIPETYNGQHGDCSYSEFAEYMQNLRVAIKNNKVLYMKSKERYCPTTEAKRIFLNEKEKFYIDNNIFNISFRDLISETRESNIKFFFEFSTNSSFAFGNWGAPKLYLCKDAFVKKCEKETNDLLYIYQRETAVQFQEKCHNYLWQKMRESGMDVDSNNHPQCISIHIKRNGKPTHLFTRNEIEELMKGADDRRDNVLVVDENGYCKILYPAENVILYPVRNETWCAGNNYVGKYSTLSTLEETYLAMLQGWLEYLETGEEAYVDYFTGLKEKELLEKIKQYY